MIKGNFLKTNRDTWINISYIVEFAINRAADGWYIYFYTQRGNEESLGFHSYMSQLDYEQKAHDELNKLMNDIHRISNPIPTLPIRGEINEQRDTYQP